MMRTLSMAFAAVILMGCATPPRPIPLSQGDVISMVKAGVTDEEIMRRIDDTRTVFRLSSDDVVRLRNDGVSDRVVNYMLDTYVRAVAAEQRRQDASYMDFRYGLFYGGPCHRW
jgi:hypothetical protein